MRRTSLLAGLGLLRDEPAGWRSGMSQAEQSFRQSRLTPLQRAQAVDCADWLPNDLLGKLDRCLMAFGIEGRVPFLDREVADLAFRLPDRLKVQKGLGKHLLRQWLARTLPMAEPFSRKRGFTVPVAEWLAAKPQLGSLLAAQEPVRKLCKPGAVEGLLRRPDRRGGFAAWLLLFYALWHRRHIEAVPAGGDVFETLGG